MVGRWGMSGKLGPVTLLSDDGGPPEASAQSQWLLDQEVQRIIEAGHTTVSTLLSDNRDRLERLTRALLASETLDAPDAYAAAGVTPGAAEPALTRT
jgi:cell division protease FtsH